MKNNTTQLNNFQFKSRRELTEESKLSPLPELVQGKSFTSDNTPNPKAPVAIAVCAGCGGQFDRDDNFQQSINGCRKCIGIYIRIDAAIEESAKRKKCELLEKFAGGAK